MAMVRVLAALPQLNTQQESRVLLYPAAGFDWKVPLALLRLCRRQINLPEPDLGIYVDYSSQLVAKLEKACASGDTLHWGPDVHVKKVMPIEPPEKWVWSLRSRGNHAPDGGSETGDRWYVLDLHIARYTLPLLYVPADAVAFVSEIMTPLRIKPTYVATVSDGCRQGGNWCCLSKKESPFYKGMKTAGILPDYWLTDHGDLEFSPVAKVRTGLYGNGESELLAIN